MALDAGQVITRDDINALQNRINSEISRRHYVNPLSTYSHMSPPPILGEKAFLSQVQAILTAMGHFKHRQISTEYIYSLKGLSDDLAVYAARPIYSNHTDCTGGCAGLCYTTCSDTCKTTCGEACYARCNTTCMVDSSSNPGCANVGCSTYCKNVCRTATCYDNPNINKSIKLVKYMDMYLGIPSVILDPDTERRFLYGKAGCFRICDYGLEYRTLSGYFLDNDRLLEFMWDQTMRAIDAFNNHVTLIPHNEVCDAINNSDVDKAEELIRVYNLLEK